MKKFKEIDKDHIIVDGKKYKRTKDLNGTCDECVFYKKHNFYCYLDGMMACKRSDIWELDEDQTVADDRKALLLEYYKWLDERGMLDKTLCYDPEHQTETFLELLERKRLPKTWEEFCKNYPITHDEYLITSVSKVVPIHNHGALWDRKIGRDDNALPDRATAEAVLALCQLIQLRDCYNDGWVPDWEKNKSVKYIRNFYGEKFTKEQNCYYSALLYFKTAELRDTFLNNFRDLIEKIKPLYGIKKGGVK